MSDARSQLFTPKTFLTFMSIFLLAAGIFISEVRASGFAIQEYSVKDLGMANAGFAANANDASTVYSNPAGMTRLKTTTVTAGAHYIIGTANFQDQGSTSALGNPLSGGEGGDFLQDVLIPTFYFATPVTEDIWLGMGFSAPFGLKTKYPEGWIGRYQSIKSDLVTLDLNPAVAISLTDRLSVGAGLSVQYVDVTLSNAVDYGAICATQIAPVAPGTCNSLGIAPQMADGVTTLSGNDWSVGFNVGVLFEVAPRTRIGLQFRSGIDHNIEGEADFQTPNNVKSALPLLGGRFIDTGVAAELSLPLNVSASLRHQVTPSWSVMADATWTEWSSVKELRIGFENPVQPEKVETLNYEDTWRIALGTEIELSQRLTLRGGSAFDESPTQQAFRTPRIPDEDRWVLALGLSYHLGENFVVNVAYNHLFIDSSTIDRTGPAGDRLTGMNTGDADILSLGITWRQ